MQSRSSAYTYVRTQRLSIHRQQVFLVHPTEITKFRETHKGKDNEMGHTLTQSKGTPNRITLSKPFFTQGPINSSSLLTPHLLRCPARVGISTLAFGSSVMNIGYMNMDVVSWHFACHFRESGCAYPPCKGNC